MLVLLSDVHLTDGTSGETINSGAFEKFRIYLTDMAETAEAKEVEIAFIGDVFDVIRSEHWIRSQIRPWSDAKDTDGKGKGVKEYTLEVVDGIMKNDGNRKSFERLQKFKKDMEKEDISVKFTYVVGNHDWLVNRFPESRIAIAEFIGMENPNRYDNQRFPTDGFWPGYRVFARHGDIYDDFNFDGERDASSLGDAIVTDLVNKFPKAVESEIGPDTDPELISELKEIDNVRPNLDIPFWIEGACQRARSDRIGKRVKDVWNGLVDDFLDIGFVKDHDKWWKWDVVDSMEVALRISRQFTFKDICKLPLRGLQKGDNEYAEKAMRESKLRDNEAEFAVFGHTHNFSIQPLDIVPTPGSTLRKMYFNTGTWRRVHTRTKYDTESKEFLSWDVMTFIAFYLDRERGERRFEVWNGALG
jgi:UDP-2,3-diacylglucosamine pyrophosphatase LpxH